MKKLSKLVNGINLKKNSVVVGYDGSQKYGKDLMRIKPTEESNDKCHNDAYVAHYDNSGDNIQLNIYGHVGGSMGDKKKKLIRGKCNSVENQLPAGHIVTEIRNFLC